MAEPRKEFKPSPRIDGLVITNEQYKIKISYREHRLPYLTLIDQTSNTMLDEKPAAIYSIDQAKKFSGHTQSIVSSVGKFKGLKMWYLLNYCAPVKELACRDMYDISAACFIPGHNQFLLHDQLGCHIWQIIAGKLKKAVTISPALAALEYNLKPDKAVTTSFDGSLIAIANAEKLEFWSYIPDKLQAKLLSTCEPVQTEIRAMVIDPSQKFLALVTGTGLFGQGSQDLIVLDISNKSTPHVLVQKSLSPFLPTRSIENVSSPIEMEPVHLRFTLEGITYTGWYKTEGNDELKSITLTTSHLLPEIAISCENFTFNIMSGGHSNNPLPKDLSRIVLSYLFPSVSPTSEFVVETPKSSVR